MIVIKNPIPGLFFFETTVKIPLTQLPVRSTLVTGDSESFLISPLPQLSQTELSKTGVSNIQTLLAPNATHHLGLLNATRLLPEAKVWGVKGLVKKQPAIQWDGLFLKNTWNKSELEALPIMGIRGLQEVAFFHSKSKTLILTDFIFNLQGLTGIKNKILFGLLGTYNRSGISQLVKKNITNKADLRASLALIHQKPFENLVMAHGDIILKTGKEVFLNLTQEL